ILNGVHLSHVSTRASTNTTVTTLL
ncbi:unnamed protein product, partial [Rotaria sordida]